MTTSFFNRTTAEQELICKAYEFEMEAIANCDSSTNPYADKLKALGLWEALNQAVEMAFA